MARDWIQEGLSEDDIRDWIQDGLSENQPVAPPIIEADLLIRARRVFAEKILTSKVLTTKVE